MEDHLKANFQKGLLEQVQGWASIIILILPCFIIFSVVYNYSYFSTLNMTLSQAPLTWSDYIYTILEWGLECFQFVLFLFIYIHILVKEQSKGKIIAYKWKDYLVSVSLWFIKVGLFIFILFLFWIPIIKIEKIDGFLLVVSIVGSFSMIFTFFEEEELLKVYRIRILRVSGVLFCLLYFSHAQGVINAINDYQKQPVVDKLHLKDQKKFKQVNVLRIFENFIMVKSDDQYLKFIPINSVDMLEISSNLQLSDFYIEQKNKARDYIRSLLKVDESTKVIGVKSRQ